MQTQIQKVTAALAAEISPDIYEVSAEALGFPASGAPLRYLCTDLCSTDPDLPIWFAGLDAEGTATYKPARGNLTVRVLGADPERAERSRAVRIAREKAITPLRQSLSGNIERSAKTRQELARRIAEHDNSALNALASMRTVPYILFCAQHSQVLLSELAAVSAPEQAAAVEKSHQRLLAWLDVWSPRVNSHPHEVAAHASEYEAVKDLTRALERCLLQIKGNIAAELANI